MDLQAELAMRLGAKRPALEQSMEVDEGAWPSDEAPEAEGEQEEGGGVVGGGEKKKKKKKKKLKKKKKGKRSRTASKVSQKSTGVCVVPSLCVSTRSQNGTIMIHRKGVAF